MEEHVSEIKEDVFFNFVNMVDDRGQTHTGALAKTSVANVCSMGVFQTIPHEANYTLSRNSKAFISAPTALTL